MTILYLDLLKAEQLGLFGWQSVPNSLHPGAQRRLKAGKWEYRYPDKNGGWSNQPPKKGFNGISEKKVNLINTYIDQFPQVTNSIKSKLKIAVDQWVGRKSADCKFNFKIARWDPRARWLAKNVLKLARGLEPIYARKRIEKALVIHV